MVVGLATTKVGQLEVAKTSWFSALVRMVLMAKDIVLTTAQVLLLVRARILPFSCVYIRIVRYGLVSFIRVDIIVRTVGVRLVGTLLVAQCLAWAQLLVLRQTGTRANLLYRFGRGNRTRTLVPPTTREARQRL